MLSAPGVASGAVDGDGGGEIGHIAHRTSTARWRGVWVISFIELLTVKEAEVVLCRELSS